jgi:hypothetical protein
MNPQTLTDLARQQTREIHRAASRRARQQDIPAEDPWAEVLSWLADGESTRRPRPDRIAQR